MTFNLNCEIRTCRKSNCEIHTVLQNHYDQYCLNILYEFFQDSHMFDFTKDSQMTAF